MSKGHNGQTLPLIPSEMIQCMLIQPQQTPYYSHQTKTLKPIESIH